MRDPDCIFCKIVAGEIPAKRVMETEHALVFEDLNPAAPVHCLVIPKTHIPSANDFATVDAEILADLLRTAAAVAEKLGLAEDGWRLVTNINRDGGQTVGHLHLHVLGGRPMRWPPG